MDCKSLVSVISTVVVCIVLLLKFCPFNTRFKNCPLNDCGISVTVPTVEQGLRLGPFLCLIGLGLAAYFFFVAVTS